MSEQLVAAQPCIWMAAGLINYRLCTRDFDCEHCALDAALHGDIESSFSGTMPLRCAARWALPDDRLYSTGHTWVYAQSHGVFRVGIDAFAAALIGSVSDVRCDASRQMQMRGAPLCSLDIGLGSLSISTPVAGRLLEANEALRAAPDLLVARPYDDGWLAEIAVPSNVSVSELLTASAARSCVALDLRRFRRAIAIGLFADAELHDTHAAEPERFSDLRAVIAGDGYLELLRQFIH